MNINPYACFTLLLVLTIYIPGVQTICDSTICSCVNSTCQSCLFPSFVYSSTLKLCTLCPPQCLTCNSNLQCLTCRQMFYIVNNDCVACQKYCKTCSSTTCTQCIDGYVLVNNHCQMCQVPNVKTCDSLMTVNTCQSSFWINGDSCSPCRQFCQFCTSSNNCLKCQDGYMAKVSAGTYCVACDIGCRTCSGSTSTCSQCFYNYQLLNGICQSIALNCSLISNCYQCQYSNNAVNCVLCNTPYFISSNGSCIIGSSILCKYSNGKNPYQCLNSCGDLAYQSNDVLTLSQNINQVICLPQLWISGSIIQQIYLNSQYIETYQQIATSPGLISASLCGSQYISSAKFVNKINSLVFNSVFQPYYKLNIYLKWVPLFKSAFDPSLGLNFNINFSDNASNSYQFPMKYSPSDLSPCIQQYNIISSKNIKDQSVTIQFASQLIDSTLTDAQLSSTYPNGLIGYQEILIQFYQCDSKCRICSNTLYCLECYGQFFTSNNICVANCQGLFELYLPDGNYQNYKSKYCVQQCSDGYYSATSPLNATIFMCLKCPSICTTCKSQIQCLSCKSPYLLFSSNYSCITSCPNTHYPSKLVNQCVFCNAPCKTCINETKCLTCVIGYFDGSNCVGICPTGTYSAALTKQCLSCDSTCLACQNSPNFCSACVVPYKILGTSCLISCPINTYYQVNQKCLACKSPCILCLSETSCITCSRGYLLNNTCLSDCPSGYYNDIGNSKCNLCQNNCSTCLSISICKTCIKGTYLYNSMCLSQCPMKTYISLLGVCIPCIPPCLTCNSETSCLTCSLGYLSLVAPTTCVVICQDGYYGLNSNQSCMKCATSCLTCSQQAVFCLSCKVGLLLENNICVASCSTGSYSFGGKTCRPCSYPCATCIETSSKCLTCQSPYIFSGSNTCTLQCSILQYQSNGICMNCISPCQTCTSLNLCTSCLLNTTNQTYLINGFCSKVCPVGSFADPVTLKCKVCIFPCQTCLNSRACLSCVSGYLNQLKQSCEVCSTSYYADLKTKTCILCSSVLPNCQQCQSSKICKVCQPGQYLYNNTCISQYQCKKTRQYYVSVQLKQCSKCTSPCFNCTSATTCISCSNGYLYQGRCLFTCPDGYYANQILLICAPCNNSICNGCVITANQCTSCILNSTLNVFLVDNSTCIKESKCGKNYYVDKSFGYLRCLKCLSPCLTCSSATYCNSCVSGVLYDGGCSFTCPNQFYAYNNITTGIVLCQSCSTICLECTGNPLNCISCQITKFLQDNICVSQCSKQYYLNQYVLECLKCQSPCLQCQSATYCIFCVNSSLILYFGQCVDQCPEGTYLSKGSCVSCPSECQICSISDVILTPTCQVCAINLLMNSTIQGKCQKGCKMFEYPDLQTRKCYTCQIPCQSCYTATQCATCIDGYLIYNDQCFKGDVCPAGTFMDPFEKRCLDVCYTPYYSDSFTNTCTKNCSNQYLKVQIQNNPTCEIQCPSGYYVDSNYSCSMCSDNICNLLQDFQIYPKNVFNVLFIKIMFTKNALTTLIRQNEINVVVTRLSDLSLSNSNLSSRLLTGQSYKFQISKISPKTLWLKLDTFETLSQVSIEVSLNSYYLLSAVRSQPLPQSNLQHLRKSILLQKFDQYTDEIKDSGASYELYSKILSLILAAIILLALFGNFLSLFYSIIDYFQIFYMILLLKIQYAPALNYLLYGFRYSHYLFLPQIFRSPNSQIQYSQIAGQYQIIVPNADFLSNTGPDFIIIFCGIGLIIFAKFFDFLLSGSIKNNKVVNDPTSSNGDKVSIDHKLEKSSTQDKKTHNIIEIQILSGNHGLIAKYIKTFISRVKWNYLNDICYCIYFNIVFFSYSQTYIITQSNAASSFFSIISLLFFLSLPIFWIYILRKNSNQILSSSLRRQQLLSFKTFYYYNVTDTTFSLHQVPIKYIRKLLIAILIVYCTDFPEFVLGFIFMISVLNMVMFYLYQPYILKFQVYIQLVIQFVFVIIFFILCLMEIQYVGLETQNKIIVSKVIVIFIIILTILLILWNLYRLAIEVLKKITGKDYLENYYKDLQDLSEKTLHRNKQNSSVSDSKKDGQQQQSNVRLQAGNLSGNQLQASSFGRPSQDQYSALDMYLKKQADAPPMLIKCTKNLSDEDKQDQSNDSDSQSQDQQEKQTYQNQNIEKIKQTPDKNYKTYKIIKTEKHATFKSVQYSSEIDPKDVMNRDEQINQNIKILQIHEKQHSSNNSIQQAQKTSKKIDKQIGKQINTQKQKAQQNNQQPKQILTRNVDGRQKMKTIMQIQDFDLGQSEYEKNTILQKQHTIQDKSQKNVSNTQKSQKLHNNQFIQDME